MTEALQALLPDTRLRIAGRYWEASSGGEMPVHDSARGAKIATVARAGRAEVETAVACALEAFPAWRDRGWRNRAALVSRFAEAILDDKARLACLDSWNSGNPIRAMARDVDAAVARIEHAVRLAASVHGSVMECEGGGNLHYTRLEPFGAVVRIVPFNHPLLFAATKIVAPLLMGNTVLLKPSDYTPLSALALAEIAADIFPVGVLQVITGDWEAGDALVRHPAVKRIAFTGSAATAGAIARAAAESGVKALSTELGGKNPMIIFPDADLDRVVDHALIGMGYGSTQGQSCGSTSRVLVHATLYEEFTGRLEEATASLIVGDPSSESTDIGPLVSERHLERVLGYVEQGQREGATLLQGGARLRLAGLEEGYFMSPAIFSDVDPSMSIFREEIFGPVTCVMPWSDQDEAVRLANDTEYGLTASIWTRDLRQAHVMARSIDAGYVWINTSARHFIGMPFGGFRNSGVGREESIEELESYCETKAVNVWLES
jgi:betaine-aldehyde dehydrogenase